MRCTNTLITRTHILSFFVSMLQVPAVPVPACTGKDCDHDFGWCRLPNCRNLGGADQLQDADVKDPYRDQQGCCLHFHSLFPCLSGPLVLLPPYKNPGPHLDVKMGFETRAPHIPGCQHLNITTFTSAPDSHVLAFKAAGSQTCVRWVTTLCKRHNHPGRVAQLVGASSYTPKGCGLNPQSGHMPGLQARSPVGGVQEATDQCFSLTSMFLSLSFPLSSPLTKNK